MNCSTTAPDLLSGGTRGWVGQSNDRGTLDIAVSSCITIFLCIWTTVCVNVPSPEHGVWAIFRDRWHMFCLGLLGPEFTVLLAIGQYCSARASVRQFKAKYDGWTLKHGFFADMGGIHLQVGNLKSFPITSKQLYFLAEHDFIEYPHITTTMINDKNKSDGLARLIASLQILWFTLSTISRPIKGYATTTLEITTLAYIFCAWASMFFWRCKPMDVQDPIMVACKVPLAEIVDHHGRSAAEHFHFTPLDFVDRQEWTASKLWTYYVSLLRKMKIIYVYEKERPARHFSSFNFMAPDKPFVILILVISCLYSAIFLAAWNLHFPTDVERLIWRVCTAGSMGIVIFGGVFEVMGILIDLHRRRPFLPDSDSNLEHQLHEIPVPARSHPLVIEPKTRWQLFLQNARNKTEDKDPYFDVRLRSLLVTTPLCALYCLFRAYIIVADIITLRELPASAFMAIQWSTYIPHI